MVAADTCDVQDLDGPRQHEVFAVAVRPVAFLAGVGRVLDVFSSRGPFNMQMHATFRFLLS